MANAILIPGKPSLERYLDPAVPKPHLANWFGWLPAQLTARRIPNVVLEMPDPYDPNFEKQCAVLDQQEINEDTIMVGHSFGADLIAYYLSANREVVIEQAVFVAPWHGSHEKYPGIVDYDLDPSLNLRVKKSITIFNSLDDSEGVQKTVEWMRRSIAGIAIVEFTDMGHFRIGDKMEGPEFPELLEVVAPAS